MKRITTFVCTLVLLTSLGAQDQEWEQLNDLPFLGRHHAIGFSANGKGYSLTGTTGGGFGGADAVREFWEYTPETDSWTQLDDYPGPVRSLGIGDDFDGKYYFGFGSNGQSNYYNDLWVFDPADNSFEELPSCPCEAREHPAFIAEEGKIFMGSGSGINQDLRDWWVYDIETQEWTQKANIPGNRRHHPFQFGMDGYVYVGGGHDSNWARFDPSTDTWLGIDNEPEGRVAGTQFSYGSKGYVLSGHDRFHDNIPATDIFMEYDPATDEWTKLPPHPGTTRWAPASFIIDGYIYFFSGMVWLPGNFSYNDNVYRYNLEGDITGVNGAVATQSLAVQPNPVMDELTISDLDFSKGRYQLEIHDLSGRIVHQQVVTSTTVKLGFLNSGLYLLKLSNEEGEVRTTKLVKQ